MKIGKYLIGWICVFLFLPLYSQNNASEIKGTLVYHGDYFIFFPDKNPKELLQTSENDGIMLYGICVKNIFKNAKAFKKYELNINPKEVDYLENKWRVVYMAKVKISIDLKSIQTYKTPYLVLGFVYHDRNIKLTANKLASGGETILKSYGRKYDPKSMEKELEITPPDLLGDC